MSYTNTFSTRSRSSQVLNVAGNEVIPGRSADMVQNHCGSYVFAVDKWDVLKRFLILGTAGGTFYASAQKQTMEIVPEIVSCIVEDGLRVVREVVDISVNGRAAKQDHGLYVLAMCSAFGAKGKTANGGDVLKNKLSYHQNTVYSASVRSAALEAMPKVCRTLSSLTMFTEFMTSFRGWGRLVREAYSAWFAMNADKLSYQMVKYGNRNGWTPRDVLRLARPEAYDHDHSVLFDWATHRDITDEVKETQIKNSAALGVQIKNRNGSDLVIKNARERFPLIDGYHAVRSASNVKEVVSIISKTGLPHEVIPSEWLNEKAVWEALLENSPMEATVRNLNKMTSLGLLTNTSDATDTVISRLTDPNYVKASKIHPMKLLFAMKTYSSGHGFRSSAVTWTPVRKITDALMDAFYLSFGNVEKTGLRIMKALDVSGSMDGNMISNSNVNAREASLALALISLAVENKVHVVGFSTNLMDLDISVKKSWDENLRAINRLPFNGTDCSLPMTEALRRNLDVDLFEVYTDNETNCNRIHPSEALKKYRQKTGINSKLAVVAMTVTNFSIADKADRGMMDFVGFDTSTPNAISEFAKM